jgi:hypothetical protein
MVAPLIGAGIRAAARMAAKKAPTKKRKKKHVKKRKKKCVKRPKLQRMKEAKAETKDGVKTTEYPYIEPEKAIRNIQERNPVRAGSGPRLVDEIIDKMEYKKGGSVSLLLNGLMVLLKKARRKAGWFNVLNQQHSVL